MKHSLQQEQFFKSHLQLCVSMHFDTTLAQTNSLQEYVTSVNNTMEIAIAPRIVISRRFVMVCWVSKGIGNKKKWLDDVAYIV